MSTISSTTIFTGGAIFAPDFQVGAAVAAMQKLGGLIADMSQGPMARANENASGTYMTAMQDRFDVFSRGGGDWAPLAPYTIRQKARRMTLGGGGVGRILILIDTGEMRDSLNRENIYHFVEVNQDGVSEGSEDEKIADHQRGVVSKRLPAREIFVIPNSQLVDAMMAQVVPGLVACGVEAGFTAV